MLEKDKLVVYGGEGVFKIADIELMSFSVNEEKREYYILESISNKSSRLFIPVDNSLLCNRIKPVISYSELIKLLNTVSEPFEWLEDNKLRGKAYKDAINEYDRVTLIKIIKCLHSIKTGKNLSVSRLYSVDEEALRRISHSLFSEFSVNVSLTFDELIPFICGDITCPNRQ